MGGALWEEPIFFLIYSRTKLQKMWVKGKTLTEWFWHKKGIRLREFTEKKLLYPFFLFYPFHPQLPPDETDY